MDVWCVPVIKCIMQAMDVKHGGCLGNTKPEIKLLKFTEEPASHLPVLKSSCGAFPPLLELANSRSLLRPCISGFPSFSLQMACYWEALTYIICRLVLFSLSLQRGVSTDIDIDTDTGCLKSRNMGGVFPPSFTFWLTFFCPDIKSFPGCNSSW